MLRKILGIDSSVTIEIVVDSARCQDFSLTKEAKTRRKPKARQCARRNRGTSLARQQKKRQSGNRWNSSSCDSFFSTLNHRDQQHLTPNNGHPQSFRLLSRERKAKESPCSLPVSAAPPRCPIRHESMDIDELEGIDLTFFLSLQSPDRSSTSDGSVGGGKESSHGTASSSIKTVRKGRRGRNVLSHKSFESSASCRLLVAQFDGGLDLDRIPSRSRTQKSSLADHTA
jgi:hypothetical protein